MEIKTPLSLLFFILFFSVSGQISEFLNEETEKKMSEQERIAFNKASQLISEKLYLQAEACLDTLHKAYPKDNYLSFITGVCLIYNPDSTRPALELIQSASSIKQKISDYDFHLAYAYEENEKYAEAIKLYDAFLKKNLLPDFKAEVKHRLGFCKSSEQLSKKTAVVKISNINMPINSTGSEYVPCLPSDESFIIFTYLGEKSIGGKQTVTKSVDKKTGMAKTEGIYFEDIFISKKDEKGNWLPPHGIESVNTVNHDATISISHDGSKLFVYRNNGAGMGDIYQSILTGNSWGKPEKLKGPINSPAWEGSAALMPDEHHIIFSSERKGGAGARDLWIAELKADGSWGEVKNLGPNINTRFDEDSPFITADGMTMFFSSNCNKSIGGYDIFRCDKISGEWGKPYNVGKPVNTPQDDRFYSVSDDGKRGYYSSGKAGGLGGQDIYVVEPGMIGKPLALVQVIGKVTLDSLPAEAEIRIRSKVSKREIFAAAFSNAVTGKFLVNLPAGDEYEMIFKIKNLPEQVKEMNTTLIDSFMQVVVIADFFSPEKATAIKIDSAQIIPEPGNDFFSYSSFVRQYGNTKVDGLEYTVQVGAYRFAENFNYTALAGLPGIEKKTFEDGITRFTMGKFSTIAEADLLMEKISKKGLKKAFVIAAYRGKKISLEEVIKSGILKK